MPYQQEVDLPSSLHLEDEQVSSYQGGIEILRDQPKGQMHNILFNESQHRVVQSHRVSTLDAHTSPASVEERMIMSNMRKHPKTLADTTRVYVEATSLSIHFLIGENE